MAWTVPVSLAIGLVPGGEVDDLQAAVAERDGAVDVVSFVVGAPMAQGGRHPADDRALGAPPIQRDEAAKAAHGRARRGTGDFRASRHAGVAWARVGESRGT